MSKILISDIGEHKELRELFCNKLIMGVFQEEIDELEEIYRQQIRDAIMEARLTGSKIIRVKKRTECPPLIV